MRPLLNPHAPATDERVCGFVHNGGYSCNGSPRGCERKRFGACDWHEAQEAKADAATVVLTGDEADALTRRAETVQAGHDLARRLRHARLHTDAVLVEKLIRFAKEQDHG
jgi:hypothetical protein